MIETYQTIGYYQKNMTPPSPILLTLQQYQYLDNRNRKILKLCIMKEKSQAQGQKERRKSCIQSNGLKGSNTTVADILHKLDETNLQNIADSQRDESQQQSYDSDVHDVFQNFKEKARELFVDTGIEESSKKYKEVLIIRNVKDSELVIDFRTVNEPPSDFNMQNQPKIMISEPSSSFTNHKINKSSKQQQKLTQQQNYRSHQNQPLEQSKFYPQPQNYNEIENENGQQQPVNNVCSQSGSFGMGHQQSSSKPIIQSARIQVSVGSGTSDNTTLFMGTSNSDFQDEDNIASFQKPSQTNNSVLQNNLSKNQQSKQPAINFSQGTHSFSSMMSNQNTNMIYNNNNFPNSPQNTVNNSNTVSNVVSPPKKGKPSFMEYYHSIPVKNPTNILEKYMKRKK